MCLFSPSLSCPAQRNPSTPWGCDRSPHHTGKRPYEKKEGEATEVLRGSGDWEEPENLRARGAEHSGPTSGPVDSFHFSSSSQWAEECSLSMYSPQSLHRWGITHSESMERLAYNQGRLPVRSLNEWPYLLHAPHSQSNTLPYDCIWCVQLVSWVVPQHQNSISRIRQVNARVTKTITPLSQLLITNCVTSFDIKYNNFQHWCDLIKRLLSQNVFNSLVYALSKVNDPYNTTFSTLGLNCEGNN